MFNRGNNNLLLHWVKTSKAQQSALFPWVTADWTSFASALGNMLGSTWFDDFGNTFALKICRGAGGAALGNVMEWVWPGIATLTPAGTDTATAASSLTQVTLTTGGQTAGYDVGNWIAITQIGSGATGSTKTDVLKQIKANSANVYTISKQDTKYGNLQNDPDAYVTAPANTNNVSIIRPYDVTPMQAADSAKVLPVGIAAQAIAQNAFGFLQIGGLTVVTASAVTLITAQQGVIADAATAGQAKGAGAAWTAASFGVGAITGIATANALVPVWLTAINAA